MSLAKPTARLKICLAGSGGGHVRQLLDLEPVWADHDAFFLTEDTALGRSLSEKRRTAFVPHVALGQARLGKPWTMLKAALANFAASARVILKERPDVVITTGAGAVYFGVVWARLLGAKTVVIDSFARFDRPSAFYRLARPLAHERVVQSEALAAYDPRARVFDPLRLLDGPRPTKTSLVFATVGATLKFDRLTDEVVRAKAAGLLPEHVVLQTGEGVERPSVDDLDAYETLPFDHIRALLREAELVICHGGTGSLVTALREGCRVLAVPRSFALGEHYDDHQLEIAEAFEARGLIVCARPGEPFADALARVRAHAPKTATTDPGELVAFLREKLGEWSRAADRSAPGPHRPVEASVSSTAARP